MEMKTPEPSAQHPHGGTPKAKDTNSPETLVDAKSRGRTIIHHHDIIVPSGAKKMFAMHLK
jgi:hypothetical protein